MILAERMLDTLEVLSANGWEEIEICHKVGRSRTLRYAIGGEQSALRQEEGWAVRAGDRRRSFFYAGAGSPAPDVPWPEADGHGLRLPSARPIPAWSPPADLDSPLIGESEARGIFDSIARRLDHELPGAQLLQAFLEDGASEQHLLSSREIDTVVRQRTASLFLEARGPHPGSPSLSLQLADREASRFSAPSLARRLADRLLIAHRGEATARDRGEFLLDPEVVIALLQALSKLWIGPQAAEHSADLSNRQGRMASKEFTLIDDGRLPGGVLAAPVDGEGQPTRETVLVEEGSFRQPLVPWWQSSRAHRASGCSRRAGWRELPQPGPTHLYLRPNSTTGVASLLGGLNRGYYLLGVDGTVRLEAGLKKFAVPVSGFAIDSGRATGSVTGSWLTGSVSALLNGIHALARDLSFRPVGNSMIGSPTVLVKGLELRSRPS